MGCMYRIGKILTGKVLCTQTPYFSNNLGMYLFICLLFTVNNPGCVYTDRRPAGRGARRSRRRAGASATKTRNPTSR